MKNPNGCGKAQVATVLPFILQDWFAPVMSARETLNRLHKHGWKEDTSEQEGGRAASGRRLERRPGPPPRESRPCPGLAERSRFLVPRQTVCCRRLHSLQEGSRGLCPWKAWPSSWPQSPSAPLWGHAGSGSRYTESVRPSSLCLSVRTFNGRSTPLTNCEVHDPLG